MNGSATRNLLLGTIALVATATAIWLLVEESGSQSQARRGLPLGAIQSAQRDVRTKGLEDLAWSSAQLQQKVYEGDSVFTGEGAEARIQLDEGSDLLVGENSLVVLARRSGEMSLDVQYGTLTGTVAANQKVKLRINGKETEIQGTTGAKLSVRADGKVKVLEGQAQVNGQVLNKDEKMDVVENKKEARKNLADVKLLEPRDSQVLFLRPEDMVTFRWSSLPDIPPLVVEVAKDAEFKSVVWKSEPTTSAGIRASKLEKLGPVYWRVRAAKDKAWSVHPHRLGLFENLEVQLIQPAQNEKKFLPKEMGLRAPVRFSWRDPAPADGYQFEIAKDPKFQNVTVRGAVKTNVVQSEPLESGVYFWRVKPNHPERKDAKWIQSQFQLIARALEPPGRPKVTNPNQIIGLRAPVKERDALLSLSPSERKARLLEQVINPPALQWFPVDGASEYEVQVARASDPSFDNPVWRERSKTAGVVWKKPGVGQFVWRVTALGEFQQPGVASETGRLETKVLPPSNFLVVEQVDRVPSSDHLSRSFPAIDTKWEPLVHADQYEIEVSPNPEFLSPARGRVPEPAAKITPAQLGATYYRVRPLDPRGKPLGPFSEPQSLNYRRIVELNPPEPVRPRSEATVMFVGGGRTDVMLEWQAVEGAQRYAFEVAGDSDFKSLIQRGVTSSYRTLVGKKFNPGTYFWRVRAFGANDLVQSPWQETQRFEARRLSSERRPASNAARR